MENREDALELVKQYGGILEYASKELRNDIEFMKEFVNQNENELVNEVAVTKK